MRVFSWRVARFSRVFSNRQATRRRMLYMKTTTYGAARERLASLIEDVIATRETALITRRGFEPVAIIPAEQLVGLLETAQLLRSPKNARRLLQALLRFYQGGDGSTEMSLDEIRLFGASSLSQDQRLDHSTI